jgi:hypothetical protein
MEWVDEQRRCLHARFRAIAKRFEATVRYVDLDRRNAGTFSYEYASLLRDAGGTFGSVMDRIVRENGGKAKQPTMKHFREHICKVFRARGEQPHHLAVHVLPDWKTVYPFEEFDPNGPGAGLEWWKAYTNVKHTESVNLTQGNLKNALTAFTGSRHRVRCCSAGMRRALRQVLGAISWPRGLHPFP